MGLRLDTQVGPPATPAPSGSPIRQEPEGQLVQSRLHGAHYLASKYGNVFMQTTTPLGLAIPIYTATAPTVMLFNPSGSGVDAVLISFSAAYASGTTVAGAVGLMKIYNVGSAAATGAPVTVLTPTTPFKGRLNSGRDSRVLSASSGTITTVAGVAADFFYTMLQEFAEIATTASPSAMMVHEFEGKVIVPPGVAVWPAGSVASGALLAQTLVWEEVPV